MTTRSLGLAGLLGAALLMAATSAVWAYSMEALNFYETGQQDTAAEQWGAAVQAYTRALDADPGLDAAYKALGTAYYMAGDRKKAVQAYERYLSFHPEDKATQAFAARLKAAPGALSGLETAQPPQGEGAPAERLFWQKGWYMDLLELGYSNLGYPAGTNRALNALQGQNQSGGSPLGINFLGFYWPLGAGRQTLLGFTIDGSGDPRAGASWQLNEYIYALSVRYYPFGKIGDGLYVMGDLGPAAVEIAGEGLNGFGMLAGLGWAFPTGQTVRPLVNVGYSVKEIGGDNLYLSSGTYTDFSVNIGLLW